MKDYVECSENPVIYLEMDLLNIQTEVYNFVVRETTASMDLTHE